MDPLFGVLAVLGLVALALLVAILTTRAPGNRPQTGRDGDDPGSQHRA